jgi:hypothetical protein
MCGTPSSAKDVVESEIEELSFDTDLVFGTGYLSLRNDSSGCDVKPRGREQGH